jgi:hypothetical protein
MLRMPPSFCNSQKPTDTAYNVMRHPGGKRFPLLSQNAALAVWKGKKGRGMPPGPAGIQD